MVEHESEAKTVKNTKLDKILEKLEELDKKIDGLTNVKKTNYNNKPDANSDTYKNKRNVYLNKLNSNAIKEPKQDTLDYYKVAYDFENKLYV